MKKRIAWLNFAGVLAAMLLAGAGCRRNAPAQVAPPPAPVTVTQPVQREVVEWDEYPSRLDAVDMVEIRSRVTGYVDSIHFKEGAEVKKGDLLAIIDPRTYQMELDNAAAELEQAKSKLELAKNDAERAKRLLESKAISAEEADSRSKSVNQNVAAVQSATAMHQMAKVNMDYTHITAPIDGRIGRKLITEGNLVNGNQGQTSLLTTIVSMDPIYCYFDADERSVLKYQQLAREGKGENFQGGNVPCEVELANETGFPHKGVLDFVDNRVDPATGTLQVRAKLPNPGPDHVLQPGFFARIRVPGSAKYQALMIPDLAVGTDQSQKFVCVVNDKNIVEYKMVRLGPVMDGMRVVRSGLSTNDWVIINGLMSARPGSPVVPTRSAAGAETNAMAKP